MPGWSALCWWLALPLALLATLAGYSASRNVKNAYYCYAALKPLPLVSLLLAVALAPSSPGQSGLLIALGFSLVGDIALLFPRRGFLPGLLAFLIAHVAMWLTLLELGAVFSASLQVVLLVLALLVAIGMSMLLRPPSRLLRVAVFAYVLMLALLLVTALAFASHRPSWWLLALAAPLFGFSDGVLGWNRFRRPVPASPLWILSSYYLAQMLYVAALLF